MSKINKCLRMIILMAYTILGSVACDPASSTVVYVLLISNTWQVEGNPDREFFFTSGDDGQAEGSFTGQERNNGGSTINLAGSWKENDIMMTVDRDGSPVSYAASFAQDNPERLAFSGGGENFVLLLGNQ